MASYKTKKTWKTIGIIAAIIAIVALLLAISVPFINSMRDRNPANLLKVNESYIDDQKTDYGLEVTVDDNGAIYLDGQTSRNQLLTVQTVTLKAGTYTISGIKDVDISKMYLAAKWGEGNIAYAGTENATFVLDAETEVTVVISIEGTDGGENTISWANKTILPVLVQDDKPGDFYA